MSKKKPVVEVDDFNLYEMYSPYNKNDPEYGQPVYVSDGLWVYPNGETYDDKD